MFVYTETCKSFSSQKYSIEAEVDPSGQFNSQVVPNGHSKAVVSILAHSRYSKT